MEKCKHDRGELMVSEQDYRRSDVTRLVRGLELALSMGEAFPNVSAEQAVSATSLAEPLRTRCLNSLNEGKATPKDAASRLKTGLRITRQEFLRFTSRPLSTDSYESVAAAVKALQQL